MSKIAMVTLSLALGGCSFPGPPPYLPGQITSLGLSAPGDTNYQWVEYSRQAGQPFFINAKVHFESVHRDEALTVHYPSSQDKKLQVSAVAIFARQAWIGGPWFQSNDADLQTSVTLDEPGTYTIAAQGSSQLTATLTVEGPRVDIEQPTNPF